MVGLTLSFCAIAGFMLLQARQDAWRSAVRSSENLLAALSQDIVRNLEVFDLSLRAVQDGLALPGQQALPPVMRQALLFDRAATARYLGAILVLDAEGNVVEDAGVTPPRHDNFADRDYFQHFRDHAEDTLFLSRPFRRRLTGNGDWVIALARRVTRPDGRFGGVVVGTLRLDYFQDLFARISLGAGGAVALHRTDGDLLMRFPYAADQIGRNFSAAPGFQARLAQAAGIWTGRTSIDGVERVLFFNQLPDLPLMMTVALSREGIFAAWRTNAIAIGVSLVVLVSASLLLSALVLREMRRRNRTEAELADSEAHYRFLADHAMDVIVRLGPDGRRRYVSPSSRAMLGYDPAELVGQSIRELVHEADWPELSRSITAATRESGWFAVSYRIRHRDGHHVWVEGHYSQQNEFGEFIAVLRDITARKQAEQKLEAAHRELVRLATTDGLTGLANRRRLDEALEQEWRRAARERQPLSLFLLDLDMFKRFNDHYGHQAGDACLRRVAETLAAQARRPADLAARYGGEELALLLPLTEVDQARHFAERLRNMIAELALPHEANAAHGSVVTTSIGIATAYPSFDTALNGPSALLEAADQALYRAKHGGRNRVETFVRGDVQDVATVLAMS